ncbi:hypothetical protein LTR78_010767 [Recurvomyces mirabilis]|uniref:Uncharacterized protein n=1 Tax=Recurvomyces mirabilis TaxID=574656 RepID=A0AAE0TLZ5_9PEZI|nr:hypothetical protein LTR78_010767 [Recurvomyces mirabilis]KAK5162345.1 hypothetical protein LTS14_000692 [Recurvomyces mirabilis]
MAEVAGLVLGATSVVIEALEAYEKLRTKSSRGRRGYQDLKLELEINLLRLRRILEILLKDTSFESSTLDDLLSNPTSSQWRSPMVEVALRRRLGSAYPAFLHLTTNIFETVSSIEKSFQRIANGSKATIAWRVAYDANSLSDQLATFQKLNSEIEHLAQSAQEPLEKARLAESRDHYGSDWLRLGVEAGARVSVGAEASFERPEYDRVETGSSYTVDSETSSDISSLSYLPISLEAADLPQRKVQQDALLDTGATHCAISLNAALQLGLEIEEDEQEEEVVIRTAALGQLLLAKGRAHLTLRWQDQHGKSRGTRIWVSVVPHLNHGVLLSHDFTKNHPEVWNVAKVIAHTVEQFNVTWFNKISKEQLEAEDDFRRRQESENAANAEKERKKRLAELDDVIASASTTPQPGSTAPSIAGSSASNAPSSTTTGSSVSATMTFGPKP